ncbi:MAG: Ig-like domain-containing protein [Thermoleophilaceae bacterium]
MGGTGVALGARAYDSGGVQSVSFRVDGVEVGTDTEPDSGSPFEPPGADYSATLDTRTRPDGDYSLTAVVTDESGLTTTSAPRTLRIDNTDPGVTFGQGPDGPTNDSTPTFTFSSPEQGATFRCALDGGSARDVCLALHGARALRRRLHLRRSRPPTPPATPRAPSAPSRSTPRRPSQPSIDSGPDGPTNDTDADLRVQLRGRRHLPLRPRRRRLRVLHLPLHDARARRRRPRLRPSRPPTPPATRLERRAHRSQVDTEAPPQTRASTPAPTAPPTTRRRPSTFSSPEQGVTFRCALDGGSARVVRLPLHGARARRRRPHLRASRPPTRPATPRAPSAPSRSTPTPRTDPSIDSGPDGPDRRHRRRRSSSAPRTAPPSAAPRRRHLRVLHLPYTTPSSPTATTP